MPHENSKQKMISWTVTFVSLLVLLIGVRLIANQNDNQLQHAAEEGDGKVSYLDPGLFPENFGQLSAVSFKKTLTYEMGGFALDKSGSVWSWGYNLYGTSGVQKYGDGTALSTSGALNGYLGGMKKIEYFEENNIKIEDISSGYRFNLALDSEGNVYGWGNGVQGEMGDGTIATTNPIPRRVPSLSNVKEIYSSNDGGDSAGTSNYAVTFDGDLYVWGANVSGKLGTGNALNQRYPVKITIPGFVGDIVKIASGDDQTHILDSNGDLWYAGQGAAGHLGTGNVTSSNTFKKFNRPSGMSPVIDISTGHRNTIALDDKNVVWQWGEIAASLPVGNALSPRKVEIDVNDATAGFNKGYIPIPQSVFSGRLNYYFIDQYGRPWSWGSGVKFGFGTDLPYEVSNSITKRKAVQLPNVMGDGDTQIIAGDERLPRYLSDPANPKGRLPFSARYGVYSFNNTHPTIYDHKYLLRDDGGKYLDESGNRYEYNDSIVGGRKPGFFYKLNSAGQMTNETGVPAVDPIEKTWIGLAGKELPQIAHISASYESFVMTDVDGNIYKWGTTGSGTMAWGWDVIEKFDEYPGPGSQNKRAGLYNRYTYEVMFMRGSPMVPQLELSVNSEAEKIYVEPGTQSEETEIEISVRVPPVVNNEQLGLKVETKLHEVHAIVMPYRVSDLNMTNLSPTADEIAAALSNPAYQVIDVMAQENWSKPTKNPSETKWLELKTGVTIEANSVVWIVTEHEAYDPNNHIQSFARRVFDNYYEPAKMTQQGLEEKERSNVLYPKTQDNIVKVTEDGIKDTVGFPLDIEGRIIGSVENPPSFGYDEVKISRLSDTQLEEIEEKFTQYWEWYQPQTTEKTYKLNGISKPNNDDLTSATGELAVTAAYNHDFMYKENPKSYVKLHYLGVDEKGNKITAFNMPSETVKKGVSLERTPQDLSDDQLIAKDFKVINGQPPTVFPIEVNGMTGLNNKGNLSFTIPFDNESTTEKTVVIRYMPPFGQVYLRQVVLDNTVKVDLPRQAYMMLVEAQPGPTWQYAEIGSNVFAPSQLVTDQVDYSNYKVNLSQDYMGYGVNYVVPQYYQYVGYKADTASGDYDETNPNPDKIANLDFTKSYKYYVTIYITPQTKEPDNYTWGVALNKFGEIHVEK